MKNNIRLLILLAYALPSFVIGVDVMVMGVVLEPISKSLAVPLVTLQWLLTGYAIGMAALFIPGGKLCDFFGVKKIQIAGVVFFMLSSLMISLSSNISMMILWRVIQGGSAALIISSILSLISTNFTPNERRAPISVMSSASGIGMALGPVIGGMFSHFLTWRYVFGINIPIFLLELWLVGTYIFEHRKCNRSLQIFDISDFKLLLNKSYMSGCLLAFISYFCNLGWLFIIGIYFQRAYGLNALDTGIALLPFSATCFFVPILLSRFSSQYSYKQLLSFGFVCNIASMIAFLFVSQHRGYVVFLPGFILFAGGFTIINIVSMQLSLNSVETTNSGIASGMAMMLRWLGGSIGVLVVSLIFSKMSGSLYMSNPHYTRGWYFSILLLLIGSVSGLLLARIFNYKSASNAT